MSAVPDSVRWYATLLLLTWSFAPVARVIANRLPDRGAFIAKPVGLLATVWPIWLLASVSPIPYTTVALWCTSGLAAAVGWGWLWRRQGIDRRWLTHLFVAELVTLVAFFAYVGLRGYTPDIAGTEKPMDMAFLSSSARATEMPPADPWMAGESINYYYLGYLLNGSLARMSAVPTWVGFNLALASTFAMTIAAGLGLGYGIVRDRAGRALGIVAGSGVAFLIVIAGNMRAPVEFLRDRSGTWDAFWWQGIGWSASRVVVDTGTGYAETINEFPSFSFILGDLHPHVMALPYTIVCLVIAMNQLRREDNEISNPVRRLAPLALSGAVIGALYPLNSWDYPTYLGAAMIAIIFAHGLSRAAIERALVLGVSSVIAWSPFWMSFVPFAGGGNRNGESFVNDLPVLGRFASTVAWYTGERTSAGEFLTIFGMPWAIAVAWLTFELVTESRRDGLRIPKPALFAGIGLFVVALGWPAPVLILAGVPFAAAVRLLWRRDLEYEAERTIVATLLAAGFGLILITEFLYIQDVFSGRMNTLFKVYYQVWTLFGVAGAAACVRLWRSTEFRSAPRAATGIAIAVALLAGICYPVISAKGWSEWRGPRRWAGLDGAAYIGDLAPGDLAAIEWLANNAKSGDVVLEAPGCSYQVNGGVPTGRIAAFTGVPNVIGWTGHEGQWRGGQSHLLAEIDPRVQAAAAMYADPSKPDDFDRYGVTLLYIGSFERYGTASCEIAGPFPPVTRPDYPGPGWTEVFASGDARIYRRTP